MNNQIIVKFKSNDAAYYNFYNSPGSVGSLQSYLNKGYVITDQNVDHTNERGWVLLTKEK